MGSVVSPTVTQISECFVKPHIISEESKQPYYLAPWDLAMLSVNYIQKGFLYKKPPESHDQANFIESLLAKLKHTLSLTLVHFFPLAGRFATKSDESSRTSLVYVDCNSRGVRFIHAIASFAISDVLSPTYVPTIVQSFFDHDRALNHDGHTMSFLSIQVTELVDGIFIGCSMNHAIGDGTSYWHFLNTWSEIFDSHGKEIAISRPPVLERWFPGGKGPIIHLPFANKDEFITRYEAPILKERMFHFSSDSIARIKAKASAEANTNKISSFQSLSALVWRCITRARDFPLDQTTSCRLAVNNRSRLNPPLSPDYFGNSINTARASAKVGELLANDLGWAAWQVHLGVLKHDDKEIRGFLEDWLQRPYIYQLGQHFDPYSVMMGSSPRFDMYGNEFGLGKPIALRSGYANKFDGKVSAYPGYEGGGSIDLEVCLLHDYMDALESDAEFMDAVTLSGDLH